MRKSVFFDSWAWIGITDRKDPYHKTAKLFYEDYLMQGGIPVTTDYVLDEVFTVLRKRLNTDLLIKFGENIFLAVKMQKIQLESIDRKRMEKEWKLMKKYRDKSDIFFTDFTSFALMSELGITEVFSGDEHFEKVNMGFKRVGCGV